MRRDHILIRGYEDGKRIEKTVQYKPYCFVPANDYRKTSKFKTLDGRFVKKMDFDSISEAKEFIGNYKDVSNFPIYGMTEWAYLYLYDNYPGEIEFDFDTLNVGFLDIEVEHDDGFPTPERADKLITAITIRTRGKNFTFGYNDYKIDQDTKFVKCKDEVEMLTKFLELWNELDFDIISGWNVEGFDIPYLINRIKKVLNPEVARLLSPFKMITDRVNFDGKVQYEIQGITVLDYLVLYKKFSFKTLESYKLDDVAMEELGIGKLDFGESASLMEMYVKDYQRFIDYNIIDNVRVDEIDQKMGLIELVVARAYMAKCKFSDCLGTVKTWDTLIHDFLLSTKAIVVPQYTPKTMPGKLIGGYVKDVVPGFHRWVVGVDVKSEYPNCIMQWNISPETIRERVHNKFKVQYIPSLDAQDIYEGVFRGELSEFVGEGYCVSANGFKFDNTKPGFLAELMEKLFNDRKKYQALLKDAKKAGDKKLQSKYHNRQRALKDTLNSGYGALANQYFRWFNFDLAGDAGKKRSGIDHGPYRY
jgi:DNA polymerase elongation subunit (family B)